MLDDLEKLDKYQDKYPLLKVRKFIKKTLKYISLICSIIIRHPMFEFMSLMVIILNTIALIFYDPFEDAY